MFEDLIRYEEIFYRRLAQLRMQKNVSARSMSLYLGQNPGYINDIENRHGFPKMETFFAICEYLGVTPAQFFDEGVRYPQRIDETVQNLQKLNEEQYRNIQFLISSFLK